MDTICSLFGQIFTLLYAPDRNVRDTRRRTVRSSWNAAFKWPWPILRNSDSRKSTSTSKLDNASSLILFTSRPVSGSYQNHPVSNNFEPKSSGNAHHQAICDPFDGHIIRLVLVYVLHDQPVDVHRQPEHNLEEESARCVHSRAGRPVVLAQLKRILQLARYDV